MPAAGRRKGQYMTLYTKLRDAKPRQAPGWRGFMPPVTGRRRGTALRDEARFSRALAAHPRETGALAPSGKHLARLMAEQVDPSVPGYIVELGPGTGPFTRALVDRGIPEERLILIEYNEEFTGLLKARYPKATVIRGDAYSIARALAPYTSQPLCAVVSGLPLFNQPMTRRLRLLAQALKLLDPRGAFIQFTYHVIPPVPAGAGDFRMSGTKRIWWNMFPARVWVYRPLA